MKSPSTRPPNHRRNCRPPWRPSRPRLRRAHEKDGARTWRQWPEAAAVGPQVGGGHHRLRALKELGRLRKKQQRRRKEARTVTPTRMRQTLRVHETPIFLSTCVASEESRKCACQEDRFLQHTKSTRLRGCTAAERGNDRDKEGDAELQDGAERSKRGLAFPAGSLRAPGPAAADAGREEGVKQQL